MDRIARARAGARTLRSDEGAEPLAWGLAELEARGGVAASVRPAVLTPAARVVDGHPEYPPEG